ncbi:MAG TPA: efflux RND transporter permease subunit [Nevskiaceae bacterium]|nr:efflux RND transporter permease subunit [Nevskiaceae bacterium]
MHFTDIFIKRPVLATVISLIILLLGLRAAGDLSIRQYPYLQNAQITVNVAYPGADASLMEGFITTPIEREVATADGIDFLTSSTTQGVSLITANLRLTKDPNEALTEISAKVDKLRAQLPDGSEDPIVQIAAGEGTAAMYLSFYSEVLTPSQVTDYLIREVEPQLAAIDGVERAEIIGARTYALRVWLKPDRLTAHDLTASEVLAAVRSQNVQSAVGETRGGYVKIGLSATTDLRTEADFRQLIVKADGQTPVRLGDVAEVALGAETYEGFAAWNGRPAIFVGVQTRPDANVLEVIDRLLEVWPSLEQRLPEGLEGEISYDSTRYIRDAIGEVQATLVEALIIVIVVIFLFLGSVRNSLIPAVTVPLSLVGALFLMLVMGFSINLLTLLAMVLAIGMVVDDAIIVMENIHRHIEEGMSPWDASILGARELVGPVIAMTITLVAVYAPIGFLTGITGTLFTEFAFTLAGAVVISGIVALTLTPMMCARLLKPSHGEGAESNRFAAYIDEKFSAWRLSFQQRLHRALDGTPLILGFGGLVLLSCFFLFRSTPAELAPQEDQGFSFAIIESDGYASQEYLDQYYRQAEKLLMANPYVDKLFSFGLPGSSNSAFLGLLLKPWSERDQTANALQQQTQGQLDQIAGLRVFTSQPPALPTPGQGLPMEFVIKSTAPADEVVRVSEQIVARAQATKQFFFVAGKLRIDRPEARIEIDREKAALMGVDMQQLAADLASAMAGGEVARFAYENRSYKVIQQMERGGRLNPQQLEGLYTRARNGTLVPLSTLARIEMRTVPRSIEHAQQLTADTIQGAPLPSLTQGQALKILEDIAAEVLPAGYQVDYAGASRQFKQEGSALLATFAFALIVIYLVLSAQFESFRDPLIMLVTVPMSISGALLVVNILGITNGLQLTDFPGMTLNIYTQVGLITLIGVISKHGILIVEFANKLQEQGLPKRQAIEEATAIRLRPVLMTTAALVIAMVPLLIASGPGAAARFSMGLVIAAGMSIGTLFTLYVLPAVYLAIGRDLAASAAVQPDARVLPST